jgi:hypothetical protein
MLLGGNTINGDSYSSHIHTTSPVITPSRCCKWKELTKQMKIEGKEGEREELFPRLEVLGHYVQVAVSSRF